MLTGRTLRQPAFELSLGTSRSGSEELHSYLIKVEGYRGAMACFQTWELQLGRPGPSSCCTCRRTADGRAGAHSNTQEAQPRVPSC